MPLSTSETAPEPVVCGWCEHFFDPRDKRAHVPPPDDKRRSPTCPGCAIEMYRGSEAWAVWNSCQGIFTCAVRDTKAEAEEIGAGWGSAFEKVVPVRVHLEHADLQGMREWREADRVRLEQGTPLDELVEKMKR